MRWVDAALIHSFLNEKRNVEFQIRLPIFVWHQHNNQQWFSAFRLSSFYQFLKFRIEILLTYILRSCISSEEKKKIKSQNQCLLLSAWHCSKATNSWFLTRWFYHFFPVPFMEQKTFQKFLNKIVAESLHAASRFRFWH